MMFRVSVESTFCWSAFPPVFENGLASQLERNIERRKKQAFITSKQSKRIANASPFFWDFVLICFNYGRVKKTAQSGGGDGVGGRWACLICHKSTAKLLFLLLSGAKNGQR